MAEGVALGPDYSDVLGNIKNSLDSLAGNVWWSRSYLDDKELFFREVLLRFLQNHEYTTDDNQYRETIKKCIKRAKIFTNEVFNTKV